MKWTHKTGLLLVLLSSLSIFNSCSQEELKDLRAIEQDYVLFLDALYFDQVELSQLAFEDLTEEIDYWRDLSPPQGSDLEFHLAQADCAMMDAAYALKEKNLELTKTLVDRATYEVYSAEPATFRKFYVGDIYNFFSSWQEVKYVINDPQLCLLDWPELRDRVNDMEKEWAIMAEKLPDADIYPWRANRTNRFIELRTQLGYAISYFAASLDSGDQTEVIRASSAVRMTLWPLLRMFGPEPAI